MELGHAVRALFTGMPHLLVGGVSRERAGEERLASRRLGVVRLPRLIVASAAFPDGAFIPHRFTAGGENISPPLTFGAPPRGAQSLALVVEDPDAPTVFPFVHWVVANLATDTRELPVGAGLGVQGRNSMLKTGYIGAAPPKGDRAHRYFFQFFALKAPLVISAHPGRHELLAAMKDQVIAYGELVGKFERPRSA